MFFEDYIWFEVIDQTLLQKKNKQGCFFIAPCKIFRLNKKNLKEAEDAFPFGVFLTHVPKWGYPKNMFRAMNAA